MEITRSGKCIRSEIPFYCQLSIIPWPFTLNGDNLFGPKDTGGPLCINCNVFSIFCIEVNVDTLYKKTYLYTVDNYYICLLITIYNKPQNTVRHGKVTILLDNVC